MHVTFDDVNSCDGLECIYVKIKAVHQQHVDCLINTWILPVKTWLLIACDTAFYAIIMVNRLSGNIMTSITMTKL